MRVCHVFFEILWRLQLISRWSLMYNLYPENVQQHSIEVARIAYGIARQEKKNGNPVDPGLVALYAIFHDVPEIFTGDIPTPVKRFGNGLVKQAMDELEERSVKRLISCLPEEYQAYFAPLFTPPEEYHRIIKQADIISGLMKCRREVAAGNREFAPALRRLTEDLRLKETPAMLQFLREEENPEDGILPAVPEAEERFRVYILSYALEVIDCHIAEQRTEDDIRFVIGLASKTAAETLFCNGIEMRSCSHVANQASKLSWLLSNRQERDWALNNLDRGAKDFIYKFVPPERLTLDELIGGGGSSLLPSE